MYLVISSGFLNISTFLYFPLCYFFKLYFKPGSTNYHIKNPSIVPKDLCVFIAVKSTGIFLNNCYL